MQLKQIPVIAAPLASTSVSFASDQAAMITKTNTFFVKLKEAAARAKGAKLLTSSGRSDDDSAGQVR